MTDYSRSDRWLCAETTAREDWLDENGHVNVRYYFRLVTMGVRKLMPGILADVEVDEAQAGEASDVEAGGVASDAAPEANPDRLYFSLDLRIQYRAELNAGDRLRVTAAPVRRSEKSITILFRIERLGEDSETPTLAAEVQWKGAYVNRETRRVEPLGEVACRVFDAKLALADADAPAELRDRPKGLSLTPLADADLITSARGAVEPEWIDENGHVNIEYYMLISDAAARGFFQRMGFEADMRQNGRTAFVMESHVNFLNEMKLGQPYEVTMELRSIARKTFSTRQMLWLVPGDNSVVEGDRVLAATYDTTAAFVDWQTRRVVPVPESILDIVARVHGMDASALAVSK